jgi:hypothetical protein
MGIRNIYQNVFYKNMVSKRGNQFINKCKKRKVTIIRINQPIQHYINNTMNIIQIFKHFNFDKCFGFPYESIEVRMSKAFTQYVRFVRCAVEKMLFLSIFKNKIIIIM